MSKPNITVTFTIEATVHPDFLEWIAKDRYVKRTITRALQENNVLRASEVVSGISVQKKQTQLPEKKGE